ncbi:hypothetical protein BDR22DRAFT_34786 [Usnea florida]
MSAAYHHTTICSSDHSTGISRRYLATIKHTYAITSTRLKPLLECFASAKHLQLNDFELGHYPIMHISTEAIIAIVSLIVAAPCTVALLWGFFRRQPRDRQANCTFLWRRSSITHYADNSKMLCSQLISASISTPVKAVISALPWRLPPLKLAFSFPTKWQPRPAGISRCFPASTAA